MKHPKTVTFMIAVALTTVAIPRLASAQTTITNIIPPIVVDTNTPIVDTNTPPDNTITDNNGNVSEDDTNNAPNANVGEGNNNRNSDRHFLERAAASALREIDEGNLAQTNSANADVQTLGATIVEGQSVSFDEVSALAANVGVNMQR